MRRDALLKAYTLLHLCQERRRLVNGDISLIFLAPVLTTAFCEALADRGLTIHPEAAEPGVFRIEGGIFETWVIETDEMARRHRPVLSMVSRVFLRHPHDIMKELAKRGFGPLLDYAIQQIRQFASVKGELAMQYSDTDALEAVSHEFRDVVLHMLPMLTPEERLQGLAPEERLQGLAPEERLQGLAPEERLQGLSPAERRKLRELLDDADDGPHSKGH